MFTGGKDFGDSLGILPVTVPHGPTSVVPGKNKDRIFTHRKAKAKERSMEALKLDVRLAGRESKKERGGGLSEVCYEPRAFQS